MNCANADELRTKLDHLRDRVESWKTDHHSAMRCLDVDDAAVFALGIFLSIDVIDMNHRESVLSGRSTYDPSESSIIESLYQEWAEYAGRIAAQVDAAESDGYTVRCAEAFRRAYREAGAMCVPDSQHFVGQALTDLRDQAIEDHRSGVTTGFDKLGE